MTDADDFVVIAGRLAPPWHVESVVYQIFPDRFATSRTSMSRPPAWAMPPRVGRAADRPWQGRRRPSSTAATCAAIEQHLDHIEALGANLVYLTPFFPADLDPPLRRDARSTTSTRCSAATMRCARSADAAHARGIRVIGDITLEPHRATATSGSSAHRRTRDAPERGFYFFDDSIPHGYESWLGHPDAAEARLAERGAAEPLRDIVLRRYIGARPRRLARRRREHGRAATATST